MKSIKLIICFILLCACSSFAQTTPTQTPSSATPPAAPAQQVKPADKAPQATPQLPLPPGQHGPRMYRYMVEIPHTKEQCKTIMKEMKEKSAPLMMRFDWGCNSGHHIGFAMLPGASEEAVRRQLPPEVQKIAKIIKVEKYIPPRVPPVHK